MIAGLFLTPVLERFWGLRERRPRASVPARLAVNLPSQAGREDFVPVRLVAAQAGYRAEPIFYKSNLIFTLVKADGLGAYPGRRERVGRLGRMCGWK